MERSWVGGIPQTVARKLVGIERAWKLARVMAEGSVAVAICARERPALQYDTT